jgi:hypothetical protein
MSLLVQMSKYHIVQYCENIQFLAKLLLYNSIKVKVSDLYIFFPHEAYAARIDVFEAEFLLPNTFHTCSFFEIPCYTESIFQNPFRCDIRGPHGGGDNDGVLLVGMPCGFVGRHRRFGERYYLHLQGLRRRPLLC